jgi:hypothetical protein
LLLGLLVLKGPSTSAGSAPGARAPPTIAGFPLTTLRLGLVGEMPSRFLMMSSICCL